MPGLARVRPGRPALRSHGVLFFMVFTLFISFMPPLGGHDIPADVLVQMLVKPEGNRLRVLLRVPLGSMRDVNFPQRSPPGSSISPAPVRCSAMPRPCGSPMASRSMKGRRGWRRRPSSHPSISLPSDRSFIDFESAVAHVTGPPLPDDTTLPWNQALFDVLYDYSIGSAQSELSVHSELARLGIRTVTVLRFYTPSGAVRPFELHRRSRPRQTRSAVAPVRAAVRRSSGSSTSSTASITCCSCSVS